MDDSKKSNVWPIIQVSLGALVLFGVLVVGVMLASSVVII